jgi:hypothetical protein
VEFAHAGVPIVIAAHPSSALGAWAVKHRWSLFMPDLSSETMSRVLRELSSPSVLAADLAASAALAAREFCPARIHASLRDGMLASLSA